MSRPSASMSTVKGFSLTFDDLAAFTNHVLYSPPPSTHTRDTPKASEARKPNQIRTASAFVRPEQQRFRHRHSASSTSTSSWQSSSSHSPASPHARTGSWIPTSPKFVDHPPRRLTESERAALANYTEPEMDITDMASLCRDQRMSFEPFR
ncbi:unnamed protein product [Rhizoctonia solani]|uniref:Uncharacterized protein n=1 Tax=Rhizoctonia solani TaxID=456999 RepID=A0A8H2XSP2_9AGAM|nr:unnamed protein product [Rhizoctonia solani]